MLEFVYPGESARLLALWNGLDAAVRMPHPLMGLFAKPFGLTNYLAPVLGALAAVGIYFLVSRCVRRATVGATTSCDAVRAGRLAGWVATGAFVLSSATLSAATHVEPALFGLVATLAASLVLAEAFAVRPALSYALVFGSGLLFGFFSGECSLAGVCAAPAAVAVFAGFLRRGRRIPSVAAALLFVLGFAGGFLCYADIFAADLPAALDVAKRDLFAQIVLADGGGRSAVFAVLPFFASAVYLTRAFGDRGRTVRTTLGHVAILLLAAFGLFSRFPAPFVASAAFAACAAAETIAYFAVTARAARREAPSAGGRLGTVRFAARLLAAGAMAALVLAACIRAVVRADRSHAFADRFAARILDGLGSRTWLVTDGRLDDNLRILAARRGTGPVLVNVNGVFDSAAKGRLAAAVARRFGARAPELMRSLDLGPLAFLEDLLKADPAFAREIAVLSAPDILFSCGVAPVPEVLWFGADPKAPADWSVWPELAGILSAPKGWGSARLAGVTDPAEQLRLDLRRHLGLVANNRGVWLQDHGDDDGAYRLYALVADEIDADNVSALFNLLALADAGCKPAAARKGELDRRMKAIVDDETRRYRLWALANYYGTIRNVPALLALGHAWARSGRPDEALAQIRRAADLVPDERRGELSGMMAALMTDTDRRQESRQIFERRLAEDRNDHAALIGLVRLEFLEGNVAQAKAYLERAAATGGDDPRIRRELALLALMKGDAEQARDILRAATKADPKDVKAWALLSMATMQLWETAKEPAARNALVVELEGAILPALREHARAADEYHVHNVRAFLALRKGDSGRAEAREALLEAIGIRPELTALRERLLEIDIALDDRAAAEEHARQALRIDRGLPTANYVMGSLALVRDDLAAAEAYLKKAVAVRQPGAFALNDLAETLRLAGHPEEAEPYARRVTQEAPDLYAGWDTLAAVILDRKGDAAEALAAAAEAARLVTRDGCVQDAGVLLTCARAQAAKGDRRALAETLGQLAGRLDELTARQKKTYQDLK